MRNHQYNCRHCYIHNQNSTISFSKIQNRCNVNWYKDVNFIEYTCCCYFRHTDIPSLRSKMAAFLLSSQHLDCLFFVTFIAVVVVHLIAHWQRHLTAKWRVQFIDAQCPVNFIAHWRVHFVCFDIICSLLLALITFRVRRTIRSEIYVYGNLLVWVCR